ncbi:XdhC family protein [soil metagenome]
MGRALLDEPATTTLVRVLERHGFGTVDAGQVAAVSANGTVVGRLLRGAVQAQVRTAGQPEVTGAPVGRSRVIEAHVGEADAVSAGLACAGGATLLAHELEPPVAVALGSALAEARPAALVSTVDGGGHLVLTGPQLSSVTGTLGRAGQAAGVDGSGVDGAGVDAAALQAVAQVLRRGATATERTTVAGVDVLIDLWVPVPTVLIIGAGAIGEALTAQASLLGWEHRTVTEVDAAAAAVEGFGDADVLVLLDHSPDFDPVLMAAAGRGRGFLGLLGSRRTQVARSQRLRESGLTDDDLARFHGPVGLDLGARTPAETAVSILGQVIATRAGRDGAPLESAAGPIGA